MNRIIIIFFILNLAFIKVCNSQLADCRTMFIGDTNPGIFYEMYPLNLNGVPTSFPKSDINTYISRLSFFMPFMFADNVPGLNFNVPVTAGDTEAVDGEIYGKPITVSNFSFTASAWLRVKKTGWYTFDMKADSGAELFIVNYTTVYCCDKPTNANFNIQFKITSIPSQPDIEHPSDKVFLYQDFPYELLFSYINLNGSAYLDIHVTDPDGVVHTDITDFASQMNQRNDSEIITCNYIIEQSTTMEYWTGTVTSTLATSRTYFIAPNGTVLIKDIELVGIPNPKPTLQSSSSTMELEGTSLTDYSILSEEPLEFSSQLSALISSTAIQNNQSRITTLDSGTESSTSLFANWSGITSSSGIASLSNASPVQSNITIETHQSVIEGSSQSIVSEGSVFSSAPYTSNFSKSINSQWSSNSQMKNSNSSSVTWKPSESPVYKNATGESSSVVLGASLISTIISETHLKPENSENIDFTSLSAQQISNGIDSEGISLNPKQITAAINHPTVDAYSLCSTTVVAATCEEQLCVKSSTFTTTDVIPYKGQIENWSNVRTNSEISKSQLQYEQSGADLGSSTSNVLKQSFTLVVNTNIAAFPWWDSTCSLILTLLSILLIF